MVESGLNVIPCRSCCRPCRSCASGAFGNAARVFLLPGEPLSRQISSSSVSRERVDAAHAHAVQSAGDFVAVGIELAAGVQLGHDDLGRRDAFLLVHVHRNAAAVVDHGDRIVVVDGDVDLGA